MSPFVTSVCKRLGDVKNALDLQYCVACERLYFLFYAYAQWVNHLSVRPGAPLSLDLRSCPPIGRYPRCLRIRVVSFCSLHKLYKKSLINCTNRPPQAIACIGVSPCS